MKNINILNNFVYSGGQGENAGGWKGVDQSAHLRLNYGNWFF